MKNEHTPLPWRVVFPVDSMRGYVYGPKHPDGSDYAPLFETGNRANAFLIVQAVNSHADLLGAAEWTLTTLEELATHGKNYDYPNVTAKLRAAIAKAKGGAA